MILVLQIGISLIFALVAPEVELKDMNCKHLRHLLKIFSVEISTNQLTTFCSCASCPSLVSWQAALAGGSPKLSGTCDSVSHTKDSVNFREGVKSYFGDFVRKGGGGTPQIRNPLPAGKKSVKGRRGTPFLT